MFFGSYRRFCTLSIDYHLISISSRTSRFAGTLLVISISSIKQFVIQSSSGFINSSDNTADILTKVNLVHDFLRQRDHILCSQPICWRYSINFSSVINPLLNTVAHINNISTIYFYMRLPYIVCNWFFSKYYKVIQQ